jgi:hypothetical protein
MQSQIRDDKNGKPEPFNSHVEEIKPHFLYDFEQGLSRCKIQVASGSILNRPFLGANFFFPDVRHAIRGVSAYVNDVRRFR